MKLRVMFFMFSAFLVQDSMASNGSPGSVESVALLQYSDKIDKESGGMEKVVNAKDGEVEGWSFENSPLYEDELDNVYDPLEPFNRLMFSLNNVIDKVFLVPVSAAYKHLVPNFLQTAISNFTSNFFTPISTINFILQGDAEYATKTTFRFIINTTLGLLGFVDVAERMGLNKRSTSFSDTLKKWGAKTGPYLVLPLLGPGSLRSSVGKVVQLPIDPLAQVSLCHWKQNARRRIFYVIYGADVIVKRVSLLDIMMDLEKTSEDMYITTRRVVMSREEG